MASPVADNYTAPTGRTSVQGGRGAPYSSSTPFRISRGGVIQATRYATMAACRDNVVSGDTILVAGGNYISTPGSNILGGTPDVGVLTIEWDGTGTKPFFDISAAGEASIAVGGTQSGFEMGPTATDWTIRNIDTLGWRAQGQHGSSGFYLLPGYGQPNGTWPAILRVIGCAIEQWTNGLLFGGSNNQFEIEVTNCVFRDNSADTLSHHIYAGKLKRITVRGSHFGNTTAMTFPDGTQFDRGHLIKSRAITTIVQGNFLEGNYGSARICDISNGGAFEFTGNLVLDYPHNTRALDNQCIAYGLESQAVYAPNPSESTPHTINTILLAQNTIRKQQAEPLLDTPYEILRTVQMVDANGTPIPAPVVTSRSNIVAAYLNAAATNFVSAYPSNTEVAFDTINNAGSYSGTPATSIYADAPWAYQGEFMAALARTDTKYGGVQVSVPTWVSGITTPWTLTSIAGTRWEDVMKSDGTGIAAVSSADPVQSYEYYRQWDFSSPAWSPKNHEFWMIGGGHNATSLNTLTRFNLGKDSPDVTIVSAQTAQATRISDYDNASLYDSLGGYHSDNKPKSPHSYQNNNYFDDIDEFVMVRLAAVDHLITDIAGYPDIAGFARGASEWRAPKYWPDVPADGASGIAQLCFPSFDRASVYYAAENGGALRKLVGATKALTSLGGYLNWTANAYGADNGAGKALVLGGGFAGAFQARFINLSNGAETAVSTTGASWPSGYNYRGLAWCPPLSAWVAVAISGTSTNVTGAKFFKLTETGATTLDAVEVAVSGTVPASTPAVRGLYWDNDYSVLLWVAGYADTIKAMKVS